MTLLEETQEELKKLKEENANLKKEMANHKEWPRAIKYTLGRFLSDDRDPKVILDIIKERLLTCSQELDIPIISTADDITSAINKHKASPTTVEVAVKHEFKEYLSTIEALSPCAVLESISCRLDVISKHLNLPKKASSKVIAGAIEELKSKKVDTGCQEMIEKYLTCVVPNESHQVMLHRVRTRLDEVTCFLKLPIHATSQEIIKAMEASQNSAVSKGEVCTLPENKYLDLLNEYKKLIDAYHQFTIGEET